jgi:hypothetical protein
MEFIMPATPVIQTNFSTWQTSQASLPDVSATNGSFWNGANQTLNISANRVLGAADIANVKYLSNQGATGTVTITFPVLTTSTTLIAVVEVGQIINLIPPLGEAFDLSGTVLSTNQTVNSSTGIGDKASITRMQNASGVWLWSVDVVRGTWAAV